MAVQHGRALAIHRGEFDHMNYRNYRIDSRGPAWSAADLSTRKGNHWQRNASVILTRINCEDESCVSYIRVSTNKQGWDGDWRPCLPMLNPGNTLLGSLLIHSKAAQQRTHSTTQASCGGPYAEVREQTKAKARMAHLVTSVATQQERANRFRRAQVRGGVW
jgi:hypothetical protein